MFKTWCTVYSSEVDKYSIESICICTIRNILYATYIGCSISTTKQKSKIFGYKQLPFQIPKTVVWVDSHVLLSTIPETNNVPFANERLTLHFIHQKKLNEPQYI